MFRDWNLRLMQQVRLAQLSSCEKDKGSWEMSGAWGIPYGRLWDGSMACC